MSQSIATVCLRSNILGNLLANYDDGRRKGFFCLAINLLELYDVKSVMEQIAGEIQPEQPIKERAATAVRLFQAMADNRDIVLKLRRKPKV